METVAVSNFCERCHGAADVYSFCLQELNISCLSGEDESKSSQRDDTDPQWPPIMFPTVTELYAQGELDSVHNETIDVRVIQSLCVVESALQKCESEDFSDWCCVNDLDLADAFAAFASGKSRKVEF